MIDRLRTVIDRLTGGGKESKTIGFFVGSRSVSVETATIAKVLVAAVVVSAGTALASFGFLGFGSQSALAVGVSASDISISTHDGNLSSVTVDPELTYSWSDVDKGVHEVDTTVDVSNGAPADDTDWTYVNVFRSSCDTTDAYECGKTSATFTDTIRTISIAGGGDYQTDEFSLNEFNASDGNTTTTTVYMRFTVELRDESGNVLEERQYVTSFDVSVTNREGTLSVTGAVNGNVTTPA